MIIELCNYLLNELSTAIVLFASIFYSSNVRLIYSLQITGVQTRNAASTSNSITSADLDFMNLKMHYQLQFELIDPEDRTKKQRIHLNRN